MLRRPFLRSILVAVALVAAACGGDSSEPELTAPDVVETGTPTVEPTLEPTARPVSATANDLEDDFGRTGTVGDVDDLLLVTPLDPDDRRFGLLCALAGDTSAGDTTPSMTMPELFDAPSEWYLVDPESDLVIGDREPRAPFDVVDLEFTLRSIGHEGFDDEGEATTQVQAEVGMAAVIESSLQFGDEVFLGVDADGLVVFGFSVGGGSYDVFLRCDRWEEDLDLMDEFIDEWFDDDYEEREILINLTGQNQEEGVGPTTDDLAEFLDSI